jgi:hypothetical protein
MVNFTTMSTTIKRSTLFEASPLFAKSDRMAKRMAKRMERMKRMRTDFYSACGG